MRPTGFLFFNFPLKSYEKQTDAMRVIGAKPQFALRRYEGFNGRGSGRDVEDVFYFTLLLSDAVYRVTKIRETVKCNSQIHF